MTDLPDRLESLYAQHGTNYVQEAAAEIRRLRAEVERLREENARLAAALDMETQGRYSELMLSLADQQAEARHAKITDALEAEK